MATFYGKVRGGSLKLRASYTTSAKQLATIPNGTSLSIETIEEARDWLKTSYAGKDGYVMAKFIAVTSCDKTCTVTTASGALNIRQTPSKQAAKIGSAPKGMVMYLLDSTSVPEWYQVSGSFGTGWADATYITKGGSASETPSGQMTVKQLIANLESYCNAGWTYCARGYSIAKKQTDCANYPYLARNKQGGQGCTTEYDHHLSEKGTIASLGGYDGLQVGMEIFQQDTQDASKKGHMGVYAGKQVLNGTYQHTVYQSCSSHKTVDAKYNQGVSGDSGPNLTGMNNKWKYWGWSMYVDH